MVGLLALTLLVAAHPIAVLAQSTSARISVQSSTTRLLPVSGSVTDAAGAPLSGTVTVTFSLYDAAEHGTRLWTETQQVHADALGRYGAYLGVVTPMPQAMFSQERARWLGVEVEGRQLPRVMLVAVPYALRAADAETLGGRPLSSFVTRGPDGRLQAAEGDTAEPPLVDGSGVPGQLAKFSSPTVLSSSVITETSTNRVGLLTTDPTGGGVVDSVFTIRNVDNNTGFAVLNQTHGRRFALNTQSNGGWRFYDGGNGTWNEGLRQENGRVGVGGISAGKLNVFAATTGDAVFASATGGDGVFGASASGSGVAGLSSTGIGVNGSSSSSIGVSGLSGSGTGVRGQSSSGLAGQFIGNVSVSGTLTKGGGSFTIDHPLDPANKYLQHSFVESPDMMNVYNGNVTLDRRGEAWVTLPDWFEALNRDFRYQLTAIGAPGPNLYVASEVSGNRFKIAGGAAGARVSWQVTGIRQDAWANAHRIEVEKDKPASERGYYLHPEAFGQPAAMVLPSTRGKQASTRKAPR